MSRRINIYCIGSGHNSGEVENLLVRLHDSAAGYKLSSRAGFAGRHGFWDSLDSKALGIAAGQPSVDLIFDGPGGRGLGVGSVTGWGVNDKTDLAMKAIRAVKPTEVNLLGHSRGAVLCIRIANKLMTEMPQVAVRLFIVEPVDQTILIGADEVATLDVNVKSYQCLIARDEGSICFPLTIPTFIQKAGILKLPPVAYVDLPGTHGTATQVNGKAPIGNIAFELGRRFLADGGVPLLEKVKSDLWLNNEYCRIHAYNKVVGGQREVNDGDEVNKKTVATPDKPLNEARTAALASVGLGRWFDPRRAFINAHHEGLWRTWFPATYAVVAARASERKKVHRRYSEQVTLDLQSMERHKDILWVWKRAIAAGERAART